MKLVKPMHILPLAVATLMIVACSKTPGDVLPSEEMAQLIADVYKGEAVIEFTPATYREDSMKKVVKQSVFKAHGIDQAQFDSSMVWYGYHLEEFMKVCDRAIEILEAQAFQIPEDAISTNQILVAGDSAQVWPLSSFYHLTASTPTRLLNFRINADENWERGDEYTLAFKVYNSRSPINTVLAAQYESGITDYNMAVQNDDGWSRVLLRLDTAYNAKAIYGSIEFAPGSTENIYLDSISLVRTRMNPNRLINYRNVKRIDRGANK